MNKNKKNENKLNIVPGGSSTNNLRVYEHVAKRFKKYCNDNKISYVLGISQILWNFLEENDEEYETESNMENRTSTTLESN